MGKVKIIGGAIAGLLGVFLGVAYLQPEDYRVVRSTTTKAPASAIFSVISDFHRFPEWSPWERRDPAMKRIIAGSPASVGSSYSWEGNDEVGSGKMTMVEVIPDKKIGIKLEFYKPFASECTTTWAIEESGNETTLTWAMTGKNSGLMSKAFALVVNMDKMIGQDFDEGLQKLKSLAEGT